jgi:hypothetical protein
VLRHQYLPWIGAPDFGRPTIARCSVLSNGKRAAGGEATGKPYAALQNSGLGKFELLYLGSYNKNIGSVR